MKRSEENKILNQEEYTRRYGYSPNPITSNYPPGLPNCVVLSAQLWKGLYPFYKEVRKGFEKIYDKSTL